MRLYKILILSDLNLTKVMLRWKVVIRYVDYSVGGYFFRPPCINVHGRRITRPANDCYCCGGGWNCEFD